MKTQNKRYAIEKKSFEDFLVVDKIKQKTFQRYRVLVYHNKKEIQKKKKTDKRSLHSWVPSKNNSKIF